MKSVERNRRERREVSGNESFEEPGFRFVLGGQVRGAFTVGLGGRGNFEEIGSVGSVRLGERAKRIKGVAAVGREDFRRNGLFGNGERGQ